MRLKPKLKRMEHIEISGEYPWIPFGKFGRFISGRPMDNIVRTNADFLHDATKGYPSRWLRLAGWKRSAIRIISIYGLCLTSFSAFSWRMGAHSFVLHLILWNLLLLTPVYLILLRRLIRNRGLSVWVLRKTETDDQDLQEQRYTESGALEPREIPESKRSWQRKTIIVGRRQWEREIVIPLARAVAPLLQLERRPEEARTWVIVPRNYQDPGADPVEILLPPSFSGAHEGARRGIERAIGARLQMKEVSASWELHGEHPRLLIRALPKPPEKVTFSDVEKYLLAAEEYRPLLGLTGASTALHAEMVADSPHIAISGGPGSGKSTLMKALISHFLHWGWGVVIIDWKQTEAFKWAINLPGVTYVSSIERIHAYGVRIGQEVDIRKAEGMGGRAKVLVVRDEWNATADLLMAYWQDLRATADPEEKKTMPLRSPALRGYATLDFAGREFGLHDLVAAQRFSARVFNGNADIRECFQIKCLARYTEQTRKMLVPDIKPFPRRDNTPGRWAVVAGDEVVVVQVPFLTGEEARAYSQGGNANPVTPFSSSYTLSPAQHPVTDRTQEDQLGDRPATPNVDPSIIDAEEVQITTKKLSELAEIFEPFGITLEILRHATKDPESGFPAPYGGTPASGYTYDVEAVKIWTRRRHASQIAAKEAK